MSSTSEVLQLDTLPLKFLDLENIAPMLIILEVSHLDNLEVVSDFKQAHQILY